MALDPTGPIDPDRILDRSFATVRRGVDPSEVERYLLQIANQMRATASRVQELERELENYRRRPPVVDPIDPSNLNKLLGEETTRVLDAAHSAAAEIRARAEENVARMLREAREESTQLREEAETHLARRTAEADAEVAAMRERIELERERAESEAAAIIDDAKQQGRDTLAETQQYRQRMLDDLSRRRQSLRDQIEQLQASRDRLAAAYDVVRDTLAVATEELQVALPDARFAAENAALRAAEAELEATVTPIVTVDDVERAGAAGTAPAPTPPVADASDGSAPPRLTVVPPVEEPPVDQDPTVVPIVPTAAEPPTITVVDEVIDEVAGEMVDTGIGPESGTDAGPEVEPAPVPIPASVRRAPEPVEGRHSSSVRVVRTGRAADVFARLREEGAAEAAAAAGAADDATATDDGDASAPADSAPADSEVDGSPDDGSVVTDDTGADTGADAATAASVGSDAGADDQAFLATRDASIAGIVTSLTRRVKRELSDEQNELLATVGTVKGNLSAIALLPTPESQLERYEDIALPALADAAEAGAAIAPVRGRGSSRPSVGDLASDLASAIVGPLRDRLEQAVVESAGDRDDLTKRVRSTFREWKGQRIDAIVEFAILGACNRGILDRLPRTIDVRWVVAESDAPSPDCEDNSLAGSVRCGTAFPTGHVAPPLHPGCHCAVLPARD